MINHNNMNITHEFWDFIEKYYPNYHTCDNILYHSNLKLYIDGHESTIGDEMTIDEAEDELNTLSLNIMDKAIVAYTKGEGIECQHCSSQQGNYCSYCGKLIPEIQKRTIIQDEIVDASIEDILSIIKSYGSFSVADVQADTTPLISTSGGIYHFAEEYLEEGIRVIVRNIEGQEVEACKSLISYKSVDFNTLSQIHQLALRWEKQNEE